MRKIKNYSVRFVPKQQSPQTKNQTKSNSKKLTKDRQEFINKITASGFKEIYT